MASFDDHIATGDLRLADVLQDALLWGSTRADWHLSQPNGGFRHMRTHARVLDRMPDGAAEVVGYTLDVTAERQAEALALSAARLATLGEMSAGLAHEIKQPLQALSLAAEVAQLALDKGQSAEAAGRLGVVMQEAQRAASIIEHLRRFARGSPTGTPPTAVPLAAVVEGALRLTRALLEEIGADVEVTLGTEAPVALGDPIALEQVLVSLLTNARDALAARPAGAPRRIRITTTEAAEHQVEIAVADTGGGVPDWILARLFEPFTTTKGPNRGTGLGLAVSYGLVRALSGDLSGRNEDGGAIFTLKLPAPRKPN